MHKLSILSFIAGSLIAAAQDFGVHTATQNDLSGDSNVVTRIDATVLSNKIVQLSGQVELAATNSLFATWFANVFMRTNLWDTAFGWGNWAGPVASNTAAILVLQTNAVPVTATNGWTVTSHDGFLTNEADLAATRLYHYGSADIVETDEAAFTFDPATGTVTAYNYAIGGPDVVIPWQIGGSNVVAVGSHAFDEEFLDTHITSVIAPASLVSVGFRSFYYCLSLVSFSAPYLTAVGASSFTACINLPQISLSRCTEIGDVGFSTCFSLNSVSLPLVGHIGVNAFNNCSGLTAVYCPSVTNIDDNAFAYASSLSSVSFACNAPFVGTDIFFGITPNQVTNYVTSSTATGWSSTFGGMPVVRLPLYADSIYQSGKPVATTQYVDGHITGGAHTNLLVNVFRFPDNTSVSNGVENGTNFVSFTDPTGLTNAWLVLPW